MTILSLNSNSPKIISLITSNNGCNVFKYDNKPILFSSIIPLFPANKISNNLLLSNSLL